MNDFSFRDLMDLRQGTAGNTSRLPGAFRRKVLSVPAAWQMWNESTAGQQMLGVRRVTRPTPLQVVSP